MFTPLAVGGWQGLIDSVLVHSVGLYLRLTDSCITQRKAKGTSRTHAESKEEEEEKFPQFNG